jgi:hypothetical protein
MHKNIASNHTEAHFIARIPSAFLGALGKRQALGKEESAIWLGHQLDIQDSAGEIRVTLPVGIENDLRKYWCRTLSAKIEIIAAVKALEYGKSAPPHLLLG